MESVQKVTGTLVDVMKRKLYGAEIFITDGKISRITETGKRYKTYILPGFIDAHVHIESSMLPPSEFARLAVVHGTVATVSDPHEIANVLGVRGVEYMIANGRRVPFKFFFGSPSCVPATVFETSGASVGLREIDTLLSRNDVFYLSEMMDFPGVIHRDKEVMAKIAEAKRRQKPIDGHAPGLRSDRLRKYIAAGITTDHESFKLDEALEKISLGMKIIIREGSAAKNYDALHPLLKRHSNSVMFGSDDKHPDALVIGHVNELVKRSVALGYDVFDVLAAACVNPVKHYRLPVGLLKVGDPADFIEVADLKNFRVIRTVINGRVAANHQKAQFDSPRAGIVNNFTIGKIHTDDFFCDRSGKSTVRVIEALDGQLITNQFTDTPRMENSRFESDVSRDILKIVVVNRYRKARPTVGFIKNFGLKKGAIASSVAHDSHNIIAVGANDRDMIRAVNLIIEHKGGIAAVNGKTLEILPLPIAGLMSDADGYEIAQKYSKLDATAKAWGSNLSAPFMTLSFMALPVIPSLKMTDKGLFDVTKFSMVTLFQ